MKTIFLIKTYLKIFILKFKENPLNAILASSRKVSSLIRTQLSFAKVSNTLEETETYLVLCPGYPSDDDLYNRMFIHSRVKAYQKNGISVKVLTYSNSRREEYVFDGVPVVKQTQPNLHLEIDKVNPKRIIIHTPYRPLTNAVIKSRYDKKTFAWVHGLEAESWRRRLFEYTEEEILKIKDRKDAEDYVRMKHNSEIYNDKRFHFVFVSKWMKEIAEHDANSQTKNFSIINNFIDTELFSFEHKHNELRKKILTIRPFASRKYANDLMVNAIINLSKKEFFKDLNFTICGSGRLFDELLKPIKEFNNVKIINKFLTAEEIKQLHKSHGIFLCPTRLDAQGVSFCEALSSGLVGITSEVAAIPEFFNQNEVILTEPESYSQLAQGVELLYNKPDLFQRYSESGAKKVRSLFNLDQTIMKEIDLLSSDNTIS